MLAFLNFIFVVFVDFPQFSLLLSLLLLYQLFFNNSVSELLQPWLGAPEMNTKRLDIA